MLLATHSIKLTSIHSDTDSPSPSPIHIFIFHTFLSYYFTFTMQLNANYCCTFATHNAASKTTSWMVEEIYSPMHTAELQNIYNRAVNSCLQLL